jgi:hypothetical protein
VGLNVELFSDERPEADQRCSQWDPFATVADPSAHLADAIERAQRDGPVTILDRIDLYGVLELRSDAMHRVAGHRRTRSDLSLRFIGDQRTARFGMRPGPWRSNRHPTGVVDLDR